jgi:hypothetical protein
MNDFFAGDLHELTEKLAYEYWERRGRPYGSPEIDWFAAEKALGSSRGDELSLYSLRLEPNEGPYRSFGSSDPTQCSLHSGEAVAAATV